MNSLLLPQHSLRCQQKSILRDRLLNLGLWNSRVCHLHCFNWYDFHGSLFAHGGTVPGPQRERSSSRQRNRTTGGGIHSKMEQFNRLSQSDSGLDEGHWVRVQSPVLHAVQWDHFYSVLTILFGDNGKQLSLLLFKVFLALEYIFVFSECWKNPTGVQHHFLFGLRHSVSHLHVLWWLAGHGKCFCGNIRWWYEKQPKMRLYYRMMMHRAQSSQGISYLNWVFCNRSLYLTLILTSYNVFTVLQKVRDKGERA